MTDSRDCIAPIDARLCSYVARLDAHPFFAAVAQHAVPRDLLCEFASHQYADSILWIPMLALMRAKASTSPRLQRAIEDNIRHEAGLGGTSHVTLANRMLRSLGVASLQASPTALLATGANEWLTPHWADFTEPEVAGFLLAAETLVPRMFARMQAAFEELHCDTEYFRVHVAVDGDEHSAWMREAVQEVLTLHGPGSAALVLRGMAEAWDETREIPDELVDRLTA